MLAVPVFSGIFSRTKSKMVAHRRSESTQFSFILLPFLLVACAPQDKLDVSVQPDWVTGPSQQYTGKDYFVGKGKASALDVAAKNARNVLARTLPELSAQSSSESMNQLSASAEVVDAWFDKNSQQHYALVIVEKAAAIQHLRQQVAELNARTQQHIREATEMSDPLSQIRATREALSSQPQRADLLLALQTLGDDATADASVWSITELQVHLESLLSSIDVRPLGAGDRQLDSAVVRGLDAAGYLSTRPMPSFELKTSLERSGMKWEQGWFTEHGTLSVELLDRQQQVLTKAQWPLRARAQERAMLEKAFMGEVTSVLSKNLEEAVLGLTAE